MINPRENHPRVYYFYCFPVVSGVMENGTLPSGNASPCKPPVKDGEVNVGKPLKPAKVIYAFLVENGEQGGGSWIRTPTTALGPVDSTGFIQFGLLCGLLEKGLLDFKCRMLTLLTPSVPFWV